MLSESVAQYPIIAVSDGKKIGRNSRSVENLPGSARSGPTTGARDRPRTQAQRSSDEHERRRPVFHRAEQIHAAIDDENVQPPEQHERQPLGSGVSAEAGAEERRPRRNERLEQRLQRLAADPRLNPETIRTRPAPASTPARRAECAVSGTREDGKRDADSSRRMRIEQNRNQDDRVSQQDVRRAPATSSCRRLSPDARM